MVFRFIQGHKKQKQRIICNRDHTCDLQSLKYFLFGSMWEKFASPWSRISVSKSGPSAHVASWVCSLTVAPQTQFFFFDLKISGLKRQNICLSHLLLFSWLIVSYFVTPGLQHARLPCFHCLPEFAQTPVHWVGNAIQPSHSLSPSSPPALNLSQHQRLFQWVSSFYQVANEYSRLISFRIDWFELLAVQGTLKSLLQHYSSKASVLQHSVFFMV